MLSRKDTDWLNGYKNKTHIYAVYKRPTSDLGTQTDGEIYHVLGLEESIFENDYTTQSSLQLQCKPYQITSGILYRSRTKILKICMETQKTPNSQSNLEGKKQSWRNQTP